MSDDIIIEQLPPDLVEVLLTNTEIVTVNDSIPGPQGPPGAPGQDGKDADGIRLDQINEAYVQNITSATWQFTYTLPYRPTVTVVDSAGSLVEGEVQYLANNVIRILFAVPFSGTVYLS